MSHAARGRMPRITPGRSFPIGAIVALSLFPSPLVVADTFILRSGARIQGEWLNREETPTRRYVVGLAAGGQLTLDRAQVTEHVIEPAAVFEYERIAPATPDTVEAQWKMAEWCQRNGLADARKHHLWRVIELDANHLAARQALGFSRIEGKWVTRKDYFQQRGYVYYRGKWRLPQEVDLVEEQRELERREREWFAKLKTWRGQLGTDYEQNALTYLAEITDPLALRALTDNLRREKVRRVRLLYVSAIANNEAPRAIATLTETALSDADPEIFHACVDKLLHKQIPGFSKALTDVLRDSNNQRVNRAAFILGRLGDRSAIPALVSALVTTHQVSLPAIPGGTTATFVQPPGGTGVATSAAPASGGGMFAGLGDDAGFSTGRPPKSAPVQVSNQEVLGALVRLSGGQSFGFDQRAWNNWWASASRLPVR